MSIIAKQDLAFGQCGILDHGVGPKATHIAKCLRQDGFIGSICLVMQMQHVALRVAREGETARMQPRSPCEGPELRTVEQHASHPRAVPHPAQRLDARRTAAARARFVMDSDQVSGGEAQQRQLVAVMRDQQLADSVGGPDPRARHHQFTQDLGVQVQARMGNAFQGQNASLGKTVEVKAWHMPL